MGVGFAEMERAALSTALTQSATTTTAAACLVTYSSVTRSPLRCPWPRGTRTGGSCSRAPSWLEGSPQGPSPWPR